MANNNQIYRLSTAGGFKSLTRYYDMVANSTPSIPQTSLHSWYDASVSSTIIQSGGLVSQWNDKSGNGRNAVQTTGSFQPTTNSTTQNGLNVINFNGSSTFLLAPASVTSNALTFFTVYKRNSGGVLYARLLSLYNAGQPNDYDNTNAIVLTASALTSPPNINAYRNSSQITSGISIAYGSAYIASMTFDTSTVSVNNAGTIQTGTTSSASLNATQINIGAGGPTGGGDQYLNGWLGEHILYTRVLTGTEINQVRSYLSTKWGL